MQTAPRTVCRAAIQLRSMRAARRSSAMASLFLSVADAFGMARAEAVWFMSPAAFPLPVLPVAAMVVLSLPLMLPAGLVAGVAVALLSIVVDGLPVGATLPVLPAASPAWPIVRSALDLESFAALFSGFWEFDMQPARARQAVAITANWFRFVVIFWFLR